ncbi:phage protein GemA/Gp16 family protein [Candidatus Nitronereus thalassa]|uniref:DUF1018 domain-containing protein n=1 Tax=Candidatus Nitronereus thalassa TaxID=3020898 RepID=A0ABU3K393_9BACT|nr:phage protein GemA/Gp16 family protein [Candidatus Nitronereus thalassa]MDT7040852.1 DUF1018 domain-containing protein [Candidatus Nitronereus thalassa]
MTTKQLKAIHACKRERGLSDDDYRDFLRTRCRVDSAKDLTRQQASALLRYWNGGHQPESSRPRRRPGRDERLPHALVTEEMSAKIQELLLGLGYDHNTGTLQARPLLKKICGQPWPQTRAQANQCIEGLKAMHARGWRCTMTMETHDQLSTPNDLEYNRGPVQPSTRP